MKSPCYLQSKLAIPYIDKIDVSEAISERTTIGDVGISVHCNLVPVYSKKGIITRIARIRFAVSLTR